jgi:hypothetical protein
MERTRKFFVFMAILWIFSQLTIGCNTDGAGDGANAGGSNSSQISSHQSPELSLKLPTETAAAISEDPDTNSISDKKYAGLLFRSQTIGDTTAGIWPGSESPPVTPLPPISKAEELDLDFPEIGLAASGPIGEINGITSGATVIAVVDDEIVACEDTSGTISETAGYGDLMDELYAFAFTDIPVLRDIRIYLSVKGEIFPMYFDSDGDGNPDTNVFSLTSDTNVSLGYLDINDTDQNGRAIPELNPAANPHVSAGIENTDFPDCLNQPDTSELTLNQLVTQGLDALKAGWVIRAKAYFEDAEDQAGSSISNEADTARFFYALTRVAVLGLESYSNEIPDSCLNTLADILDAFSFPAEDRRSSTLDAIFLVDPLPANFPDAAGRQSFMNDVVVPEIEGALGNFDAVSEEFNRQWTEPNNKEIVNSDYRDVQFFEAAFKEALALIFECLAEFDPINVSMNAGIDSQKE